MTLKQYFPISVGVFALVIAAAYYFAVPILPFAFILLFGETLIGFELENHKVPHFLHELLRAPKTGPHQDH